MKRIILTCFLLSFLSLIKAQNVGINVLNPKENLHIRTDSSHSAIRFDSKKSTEGFIVQSNIGRPSNANQVTFDTDKADWSDFGIQKLQTSNDIYLNGPFIDSSTNKTNSISFGLSFVDPIPADAIIESMMLSVEVLRQPAQIGTSTLKSRLLNGGDLIVDYPGQIMRNASEVVFSSFGTVNQSLYDNVTVADINSGNLRLEIEEYQQNLFFFVDSVRLRFDQIFLEVTYRIPATGNENTNWTQGVNEGNFSITHSNNLNDSIAVLINENGLTRLKELQIVKNGGSGKCFPVMKMELPTGKHWTALELIKAPQMNFRN